MKAARRLQSPPVERSTVAARSGQQRNKAAIQPSVPIHEILHLQQTVGNQALQSLLRLKALHAKLNVSQPRDPYEQEADQIADEVMRMPEAPLQRACSCGGGCPSCQPEQLGKRHERLQPKRVGSSAAAAPAIPPIVSDVLGSPGQPLDPASRAFMESRFGHDFSQVRVHNDVRAAQSARAVNARAFTVGNNIIFGAGQYTPGSSDGKSLLAHELVHVAQQNRFTWRKVLSYSQAINEGSQVTNPTIVGHTVSVHPLVTPSIQCQFISTPSIETALSVEDRSWLVGEIGDRMSIAYNKYVDACNEVQSAIRKVAQEDAAFIGFLIDIGLTFAVPGAGKLLARLINNIPVTATETQYKIAIATLSQADQIVFATTLAARNKALSGIEKALQKTKREEFVDSLKQSMSIVLQDIRANLKDINDTSLFILYAAYDAEIATKEAYLKSIKELLSKFQKQVEPIGEIVGHWTRTEGSRQGFARAVWLEGPTRRILALVEGIHLSGQLSAYRYIFRSWISPELKGVAIKKTLESNKKLIKKGFVEAIPYEQILEKVDFPPLFDFPQFMRYTLTEEACDESMVCENK